MYLNPIHIFWGYGDRWPMACNSLVAFKALGWRWRTLMTQHKYPSMAAFTMTNQSFLCYSNYSSHRHPNPPRLRIRSEAMAAEKLGIKIENNPPESKLSLLGVRSWPKWGCQPSKFPWTYDAKETCYLLKGKVKVYPDGHNNEFVEFGAGDLVVFPKGMSCTWEVAETVDKHYNFE